MIFPFKEPETIDEKFVFDNNDVVTYMNWVRSKHNLALVQAMADGLSGAMVALAADLVSYGIGSIAAGALGPYVPLDDVRTFQMANPSVSQETYVPAEPVFYQADALQNLIPITKTGVAGIVLRTEPQPADQAGLTASGNDSTTSTGSEQFPQPSPPSSLVTLQATPAHVFVGESITVEWRANGESLTACDFIGFYAAQFMTPPVLLNGNVIISAVEADSPAEAGGLQLGDTLLQVGGHKVENNYDLFRFINLNGGKTMEWCVERSGNQEVVRVTPRFERPPDRWSVGIVVNGDLGQVVVQRVVANSAADAAGLRQDDILLRASNKVIDGIPDLIASIQASQGSPMEWLIVRDGSEQVLNVQPAITAQSSGQLWRVGVGTRLVDQLIERPEISLIYAAVFFTEGAPTGELTIYAPGIPGQYLFEYHQGAELLARSSEIIVSLPEITSSATPESILPGDLFDEYRADPESFKIKYASQPRIIVKGEVLDTHNGMGYGGVDIYAGRSRILRCDRDPWEPVDFREIPVGQTVVLSGQVGSNPFSEGANYLILHTCRFIDE